MNKFRDQNDASRNAGDEGTERLLVRTPTCDGAISNLPVSVVREDHTLARRINYSPPLNSSATENTYVFFAQDNWQLHPRFALDLGIRIEHDRLSSDSLYAAPRIGFVFAPTRDERTAIRGRRGYFLRQNSS